MNDYVEIGAEEVANSVIQVANSVSSGLSSGEVEYEIEGADNPEDNGVYNAGDGGLVKRLTPEQMLRRKLKQLKMLRRMVSAQLQKHENQRSLEARTAKRRKRSKLEKASRKRNRR